MVKTTARHLVLTMGIAFWGVGTLHADKKVIKIPRNVTYGTAIVADTLSYQRNGVATESEEVYVNPENVRESFFNSSLNLGTSHFTWGAEIGSSLDMTAHDLSTFDADVVLGYKDSWFKIIGVGCGIHRSIRTGNNFIPVYGVIRTSFRNRPSLLFMNLQAGYSFNKISDHKPVGDFTGAIGLGINLQQSKTCKTYVVLDLAYQYFSEENKLMIEEIDTNYIYYARLSLGINF